MKKTLLFAISLAAATAAQASIEMENVTVDPSPGGVGLGSPLIFAVPQFDPSLGTLTGVELTLTPTFGAFGSSAFNFSLPMETDAAFVKNITGTLALGASTLVSYSSGQNITSPNYLANGPFATTDGPALPFVFSTVSTPLSVGTSGFIGLGDNNLSITGTALATSGGTGPLSYGVYGNVGGKLEVDYTYAPVPEATTIISGALLLLPLGASTLRFWRSRRTASR